MNSQPAESTYTAEITFYREDGTTPMSCPLLASDPPTFVKVTSTGVSEGEAARQIETFARLSPIRAGFGSAIMSNGGASFSNNFDVYGLTGNDGDVYILNGNLTLQNSTEIRGNVYVPNGSATIQNSGHIYGDLWASGSISMSNSARVDRDVKSNSGAANGSNSASVGRDAYSGSTIGNGLAVAGTKYPGYTLGAVPTQVFPEFVYNASDWAGYTIHTFAGRRCTAATDAAHGRNADRQQRHPDHEPATACTLSFSNLTNITVPGHLAIITDWGISMANNTNWNGTAGPIKNLMFLSTWGRPVRRLTEQGHRRAEQHELQRRTSTSCSTRRARSTSRTRTGSRVRRSVARSRSRTSSR